jgi:hypothetical protein
VEEAGCGLAQDGVEARALDLVTVKVPDTF